MFILGVIKKFLARIQRFRQLKAVLNKTPGAPRTKSIEEMSSDEFYDLLVAGGAQEQYYDFLLNFLVAGYLDGVIDDAKFKYFLGLNNPLQISRYVDRLLREAKMQGSIYEEMLKCQNSQEKQDDLLTLLLPEADKERGKRKITNFAELKDLVKDSAEELQKQKQALAQARMLAAEKQRQAELRQAVILNAPEAGELLSKDVYAEEQQQIEQTAGILYQELQRQHKGTVLRKAVRPEAHSVISADTSRMSPGELVAYKQKILSKMRRDMGAGSKLKKYN